MKRISVKTPLIQLGHLQLSSAVTVKVVDSLKLILALAIFFGAQLANATSCRDLLTGVGGLSGQGDIAWRTRAFLGEPKPEPEFPKGKALAAAEKITAQILQAGHLAQKGDLDGAYNLLQNERLLNDTGFGVAYRGIYVEGAPLDQGEEQFAKHVLANSPSKFEVVGRPGQGRATLPMKPSGCTTEICRRWAMHEWLRTQAEELGHIAQIIFKEFDPSRRFLSELFHRESFKTGFQEIEERGNLLNTFQPPHRKVQWLEETDIYAFLIEAFGGEIMPVWTGANSSYSLRQVVDEQGLNRRWP